MSKPTFARILRRAREQAGLSVADLATATGLTRQTIHGLENGRIRSGKRVAVEPTWDAVQKLIAVLGGSVDLFSPKAVT